jgi:hypothetical protein
VRIAAAAGDGAPPFLSWYGRYLASLAFLSNSGPLWFALALLVMTLVYTGCRALAPRRSDHGAAPLVVTDGHILALVATIAALAFLIRLAVPAGVQFLDREPGNFMQLGFFGSYVVMFAAGLAAERRRVLDGISDRLGRRWFWLAWLVGCPTWLALMRLGGIASDPGRFFGGVHWQAAGYAAWEAFFCVAMSVGLLTRFRARHDHQGPLTRFLSTNAFGVYVFHPPILVAITLALRGVQADPLAKMAFAAALVLPACFVASQALRWVPPLRRLFS